jgi:hypothetical protein
LALEVQLILQVAQVVTVQIQSFHLLHQLVEAVAVEVVLALLVVAMAVLAVAHQTIVVVLLLAQAHQDKVMLAAMLSVMVVVGAVLAL